MASEATIRAPLAACLIILVCAGTATASPKPGSGGGEGSAAVTGGSDGSLAGPSTSADTAPTSAGEIDTWCDDDAVWSWSGIGLKTIHWTGTTSCYGASPVGITLSTTLYAADGGFYEASGNNCTGVNYCNSAGSYSNFAHTLAGSEHILTMRTRKTLLRAGWTWKAGNQACTGLGTPTLTCNYRWPFTLSTP
jgi:hypothetical protein